MGRRLLQNADYRLLQDGTGKRYLQRSNEPPTVALSSPSDSAVVADLTPPFEFTGTDDDGEEINYEIEVIAVAFEQCGPVETADAAGIFIKTVIEGYGQSWEQVGDLPLRFAAAYFKDTGDLLSTGDMVCKVYEHDFVSTGFGTDSIPDTGQLLATSELFDVSTLPGTVTKVYFEFLTQLDLVDGHLYVITFEYTPPTVTFDHFPTIEVDQGNGHAGNASSKDSSGVWAASAAGTDLIFELYSADPRTPIAEISDSDTTGSATWVDTVSDNDAPYPSGRLIRFTPPSDMDTGRYGWRVRGIDPSGTNTYGEWSSQWLLTVTSGPVVSLTDTVDISSAVSKALTATRALANTISISDTVTRVVADTKALSNTVDISDTVARAVADAKALANTADISAAVAKAVAAAKALADTVDINNTVARAVAVTKGLANTVDISDTTARAVADAKALSNTVDISAAVAKQIAVAKVLGDTVDIDNTVSAAPSVILTDTVEISNTVATQVALQRALANTVNISDSVAKQVADAKTLANTIDISDVVARQVADAKALSNTIDISDAVARQIVDARTLADTVDINGVAGSQPSLTAATTNSVPIVSTVATQIGLIRLLSDEVDIDDSVVATPSTGNAHSVVLANTIDIAAIVAVLVELAPEPVVTVGKMAKTNPQTVRRGAEKIAPMSPSSVRRGA